MLADVPNGYGVRDATQLVSGAIGLDRNDPTTLCAQGFAGESSGNPKRKQRSVTAAGNDNGG
jgi:hypothetical protein